MEKNKLHPSLIVLFLVFLPADASASGQPQYMALVPSLLHTETPEKACLLLSHLNETVTVSVSLDSLRKNESVFTDLVVESDLFRCVSFTVPRISSSEEVMFLSVRVKGATHEFRRQTTVVVKNLESLVFVQTDKPIYKPGQTVKFRVVSLDENFHPLSELIPLVCIEDPKGNRIAQWQKLQLESGLKQLSFPLSSEPFQGNYKVVVQKESGERTEQAFTVEEFVLPKFEVKVTVPKIITILDEEVTVSVCGTYTYGKPVPGHVTMSMCRKYHNPSNCFGGESQAICEKLSQKLNSQGCISQQVKTKVFQLKREGYKMELEVEAKIKEEGTDVELTGRGLSEITRTITELSFVQVDPHFRQGIPFFGQVRLQDGKGVPMGNRLVYITANAANHASNATTDQFGLAQFSINTTNVKDSSFSVRVKYKDQSHCFDHQWLTEEHRDAYHTATRVFSPSKSFVHLEPVSDELRCGQTQIVQAHYVLNGQVLKELKKLTFYYLIMAKGGIVRTGFHILTVKQEDMKGHFSVPVPVEPDIAPVARLLIYAVLPDGEVVGDSAKYEVENCLANKVGLSFNPEVSLPASQAQLRVSASPQSLCALRAVDQSVLLMKPEAELSPSSVYNLLPVKDLTGFPESLNQQQEADGDCVSDQVHINGIIYSPVSSTNEKDMYSFLQDMGLKVFTNSKIHKPKVCSYHHHQPYAMAAGVARLYEYSEGMTMKGSSNAYLEQISEPVTETVRKYFPETWIWDLVVVDSSGVAEVGVTVPDTITEWKAGAFCLSDNTGIGLSLPTTLRAFQPFFVELTMPYSVVRGEAFTLKATVLNYLPSCIRVKVDLEASPAFLAVPGEEEQDPQCICGNGRQTVSWAVTPKSLGSVNFTVIAEALTSQERCGTEVAVVPQYGKKDTVIKPLLVEPEGIEKEATFNSLLCPSGAEVPDQISLKLPPNVVEDSARASFSVLGDILASAMRNTQNLLKMPYGCGEQNMVLFTPNIYVLNYLNETQQLTPEVKSKAIGFLNTGYQRQLNYKHSDGSYSTFGETYGRSIGNTWLTAFVLKTFAQARSYIFIDEAHINQALTWLSQKQKDNGCFRSSGSLLNNAIKGGVEDEETLSAYITIALLEIPLPTTHPVVRNAMFCLESAWKSAKEGNHGSHVYTKALLAYAFALAGNQEKRNEVLQSLNEEAVKEDNSVHWTRPQKPKAQMEHFYQPQAPSAEVEMTSYVLLAHLLAQPAPTSEELTSASHIVKWITKQQNSQGGFSSTQDTVVALHALSKYGAATFTRTGKPVQVNIQSPGTFSTDFQVDNDNRLLLQQVSLPKVPGEYSVTATGKGCVYLQTSLKYNVLPKKEEFPFALGVQTLPQTCDGSKAHTTFQVSLNVSYTGNRPVSNMAIVDVKMVSGFIPLKPTVKMLERSNDVSRTEVSNNHVLIYLDKVTNQTMSLSFTVLQDIPVRDLKPAVVKVYDYYETDEFAIAEYNAPCSKDHGNE
ncbi:alpha-2-macroglobulin isoform X6 [Pipistrellus kuhlii]|uniref:Alpha-2-macroglobulin n=1 Tax=Pipistrellus kuhlii TaxID=59472 RepID=A0A7J7ZF03_PIPKU|nr:alpha-2-macroglobulin isoform X6 [Pipistrellus kuhlii]KAF6372751.1 alpha-2-macroglobulin [Pipistrellus kuhlii]